MPLRIHLLALPALLSSLCLMGCGTTVQTVLAPSLQVPASLLTCPAQPVPGKMVTDTDVTDWMMDALDAGQTCRSNLAGVAGLLATQKGVR